MIRYSLDITQQQQKKVDIREVPDTIDAM